MSKLVTPYFAEAKMGFAGPHGESNLPLSGSVSLPFEHHVVLALIINRDRCKAFRIGPSLHLSSPANGSPLSLPLSCYQTLLRRWGSKPCFSSCGRFSFRNSRTPHSTTWRGLLLGLEIGKSPRVD